MKFSDMDEFLRDNPDWQENRKLTCTCEQQKYKEHLARWIKMMFVTVALAVQVIV